ncbi:MAG TPA: hypothetical protein VFW65_08655, partial [Pseudonocardiaceae bacterium]|nr:hypothetical protein [Pseudonocardiaceae bacterium]
MGTRRLHLLVVPTALALLLAGCGSKDAGPDPAPVADGLARGLASGDLSGVVFGGTTTPAQADQQYAATVADLGEVSPKVTVASVSKSSDTAATAT